MTGDNVPVSGHARCRWVLAWAVAGVLSVAPARAEEGPPPAAEFPEEEWTPPAAPPPGAAGPPAAAPAAAARAWRGMSLTRTGGTRFDTPGEGRLRTTDFRLDTRREPLAWGAPDPGYEEQAEPPFARTRPAPRAGASLLTFPFSYRLQYLEWTDQQVAAGRTTARRNEYLQIHTATLGLALDAAWGVQSRLRADAEGGASGEWRHLTARSLIARGRLGWQGGWGTEGALTLGAAYSDALGRRRPLPWLAFAWAPPSGRWSMNIGFPDGAELAVGLGARARGRVFAAPSGEAARVRIDRPDRGLGMGTLVGRRWQAGGGLRLTLSGGAGHVLMRLDGGWEFHRRQTVEAGGHRVLGGALDEAPFLRLGAELEF